MVLQQIQAFSHMTPQLGNWENMPVFTGTTLLDDPPGQIAQIFRRRVLRLTLLTSMKS